MTEYLIQKNWKDIVWMVLLYLISRYTFDTPGEVINGFVCMFIFVWIMRVIFAGDGRKVVMIGDLFGLLRLIWYICSLKPLRRLFFRMYYLGAHQQPYPYLALYGSLLDTHVMMYKLSMAFYRDKTPVVRAALWRLLARGSILLGTDLQGKAAIMLGQWVDSPSDGLDQSLERSIYLFLEQSKPKNGVLNPSDVRKVMTHYNEGEKGFFVRRKGEDITVCDDDNQYHFADLLNTGISLKAYTKREVRNIYGMKSFLSNLSKNYGKFVVPELANASATGLEMPEISRVWPEYMAFAYLFGMEKSVFQQIAQLLPAEGSINPLLSQLTHSPQHLRAWRKLLYQVSVATPAVEDAVAGKLGLLPIAWHAKEIYDI